MVAAPAGTGDLGGPGATQDPGPPDAERIVSDVETLKALSDPLRLRILEAMVARPTGDWAVKELAAQLGVPPTRLYHHVELLLERDLVRVAGQRVVSGIIESRYRVAALSFRLDHRLLSGDSSLQAAGSELLHTVFDVARDEVSRSLGAFLRANEGDDAAIRSHPDRPVLARGLARLTAAQAAEFRDRLTALTNEYDTKEPPEGAEPWSFLVAFYRVPADHDEDPHD